MKASDKKVGDKVNGLFFPDRVLNGTIVEIQDHMASVQTVRGLLWTPIVLCRKI